MPTINAKSGHTLFAEKLDVATIPEVVDHHDFGEGYKSFYAVKNWDAKGILFFHMARHENGQWHVWYRGSNRMWSSFGTTMQTAVDGAQRDGWMYTG